mgnify:CR=1 FL=1
MLVVEHDEETIRRADYVIDLGPGAGRHGGALVASGTPDEIMKAPGSLTGAYISGRAQIDMLPERRQRKRQVNHDSWRARKQLEESRYSFSVGRDDRW